MRSASAVSADWLEPGFLGDVLQRMSGAFAFAADKAPSILMGIGHGQPTCLHRHRAGRSGSKPKVQPAMSSVSTA